MTVLIVALPRLNWDLSTMRDAKMVVLIVVTTWHARKVGKSLVFDTQLTGGRNTVHLITSLSFHASGFQIFHSQKGSSFQSLFGEVLKKMK